MKKLFTFFALILIFVSINAQRKSDLAVTLLSPGTDNIVKNAVPFEIKVSITNLGPDALKSTDSVWFYPLIDGNYIISGGYPLVKVYFGPFPVNAVATMYIWPSISMNITDDGKHDFCIGVGNYYNRGQDSCRDMVLSNNTNCNKVWMDKYAMGVNTLSTNAVMLNGMEVYPNPAKSSTSINYAVAAKSDVKISIKDIQGKDIMIVSNEEMNEGSYTKTVDVSSLAPGVYFVEYVSGDKVLTSKFIKQ